MVRISHSQSNLDLNPLAAVSNIEQFSLNLRCFSLLSCITEYIAIDSGGSVCERIVVIAAWLNDSQISQVGVGINEQVCRG